MTDAAPNLQSDLPTADELHDAWPILGLEDRLIGFRALDPDEAQDFFVSLASRDQAALLESFDRAQARAFLRFLPADEVADLLQALADERRPYYLALLDDQTRTETTALLAYAEDEAGGLMDPRFLRVRPDMTANEALRYLRRESIGRKGAWHYVYVLDPEQRLLGVFSLRELFSARPDETIRAIMHESCISAREDLDQRSLARLFARHDLAALPIVDADGRMQGAVNAHDIVDAVEEEATRDIQKIGGSEALDGPYLQVGLLGMLRKRAGWLAALFIGEMLTATAMSYFEEEISRAVVLALFVPLIISSGGNSGSQASTLVIRALALGEVRLRDWWRVVRREIFAGLGLGAVLATIGLARILIWQGIFHTYGAQAAKVAATVSISLVGVVLWGTIAGAMLPFILRKANFDPATASAPFVATLVDVIGLVIYFSVASIVLLR